MTHDPTRRDFLRTVSVALGGVAVAGTGACFGTPDSRTAASADTSAANAAARPIGVQLYTVRTLMEKDVEGTLAAIAGVGYREVEFAGYFDREPRALRATLDRLNLAAPSVHQPLDALRGNLPGVLDTAQILGHTWVVCPWVPERERTLAGYRALAREFDAWGAACRERGIRFGYHNHDFELRTVDGQVPLDILIEQTDPQNVAIELDLFWVTAGGRNPIEYFEKYPGRFPLWHVKDMRDIAGAREMVSVGEGDIDFTGIFARAEQAGLQHFFVEHDAPADPLASVRSSYEHLRQLLS